MFAPCRAYVSLLLVVGGVIRHGSGLPSSAWLGTVWFGALRASRLRATHVRTYLGSRGVGFPRGSYWV